MKNENVFQSSLIRTIKNLLPGCIVLKLDPNYIQGIPDLLVLYGFTWVALECKKTEDAPHRPNQDYYVKTMNAMSFATFVYPENVQQVLEDMITYFKRVTSNDLTVGEFREIIHKQEGIEYLLNNYRYQEAQLN